jgi:glycosyltransferase involved in cell wall biosynthesis
MRLNKSKHSILFVIDGLQFGGGERVFLQLASGLRDSYEIFFAALPGGLFEQKVTDVGLKFYSVDLNRRYSLKLIRQLKLIITENNIDIVHSQGARADFFARLAGKLTGASRNVCTITMPVEGFDVTWLRKRFYHMMDRFSERYVDRFIVVSDALKNQLVQQRKIAEERVVRIYNGVELDQYRPGKNRSALYKIWGIPDYLTVVGCFGRMVWQKGFEYLLQAVPHIFKKNDNIKFLIVGDGPARVDLEKLATDLNISEQVIFTGFRSDIHHLISAVDILVIPSLQEGFPMITLEGMAMAKPIVASKIEGIIEQIVHDESGYLIPPANPMAICKAVVELSHNRQFSIKLGYEARRRVEKQFTVQRMISETEKVYQSIL